MPGKTSHYGSGEERREEGAPRRKKKKAYNSGRSEGGW